MNSPKPEKTFGDYVAIALGPVLIMALVGSFVFFLLKISYQGDYEGRLRWTMFWFVFASVLVSRISIEQGTAYASLYGIALAAVTGLWLLRFVDFVLGAWCLLAIIWWCTSKLTWDCTLLNDDEDASGEGLLQAAGLDERSGSPESNSSSRSVRSGVKSGASNPKPASVSWRRRLLGNRSEREGQPHAPGLWVIFFSLVALPLFGIGQALLPASNSAARKYGFQLLLIYVASALGLLLTTSFLGLRRYLRQRHLQMPATMATSWIALGTSLALLTLSVSVLLPRPEATYSLPALIPKIVSAIQSASNYAFLRGDAGKGEGRRLELGQSGEEPMKDSSAGSDEESSPSPGAPGKQLGRGGTKAVNSTLSTSGTRLANLLKGIFYALLVLLALYFLMKNWSRFLAAMNNLIQELRNLWNRLFGSSIPARKPGDEIVQKALRKSKPFVSFANPFDNGRANQITPEELVRYSFEALQAWARDQNLGRPSDQTPLEFARLLEANAPALSSGVRSLVELYVKLAYAGRAPAPDCVATLEQLWRVMSSSLAEAPLPENA